jgi:spore germination cell wall hydrolase CwlJ-like protein
MKSLKKGLTVLVFVLSTLTHWSYAQAELLTATPTQTEITPQMEKELLCLALNIFYEARGEPEAGMIAVAQVSINRVNDDRFPNTICDVVKQRTVFETPRQITSVKEITTGRGFFKKTEQVTETRTVIDRRVVCQFSWYCTNSGKKIQSLKSVQSLNSIKYYESLEIAKKVLFEGLALDHLKDALYFHSRQVKPNWGKVKVTQIGNHIFYRDHQ